MRIAHINNGVVTNVTIGESVPQGCVDVTGLDVGPGWIYAEGAFSEPVPLLDQAQSVQLARIDAAFADAASQPVDYMGAAFQSDAASVALMAQAITGLQALIAIGQTVPADFGWWDAGNAKVDMTLTQLQGLFATGTARYNTLFAKKQALKADIRAAATVGGVQAVVW